MIIYLDIICPAFKYQVFERFILQKMIHLSSRTKFYKLLQSRKSVRLSILYIPRHNYPNHLSILKIFSRKENLKLSVNSRFCKTVNRASRFLYLRTTYRSRKESNAVDIKGVILIKYQVEPTFF